LLTPASAASCPAVERALLRSAFNDTLRLPHRCVIAEACTSSDKITGFNLVIFRNILRKSPALALLQIFSFQCGTYCDSFARSELFPEFVLCVLAGKQRFQIENYSRLAIDAP
jgi:hypothetical protein